jgi:hypothetical protein
MISRSRDKGWKGRKTGLALVTLATAFLGSALVATTFDEAPAGATTVGLAASSGSGVTQTETLSRSNLVNGVNQVVDQRSFSVSVSQTTDLRNRQEISVSWTGAHPTGGIVSNEQSSFAAQQEYPVVLMECRGIDSAAAPASERLSPETCWTATPNERVQTTGNQFPLWSLDQYATNTDRGLDVNTPAPYPAACEFLGGPYQYWVPFVGADGTVYPTGPNGCDHPSPDETNVQDPGIVPSDTTYAQTTPTGVGSVNFTVATAETNASLGCSNTVPCSLVVIPIEGISCDPTKALSASPADTADVTACEAKGNYAPREPNNANNSEAEAVSGLLWWSASNWRFHIAVPLSFAEPSDVCSLVNSSAPVDIYGSELMAQATQQWNPAFCLNPKLFNVQHVQTSEPEAKNLLHTGAIDAAFEGEPPAVPSGQSSFFSTPTVQAPVGITGFAIAYVIDNANGQPYLQLKLDPRLLAKLMTESYAGDGKIAAGDPGIAGNPYTIYNDPEFKALNPTFSLPGQVATDAAASLFSIASQSDVIWALTSYINADPEARAWLNGQPDPWGMVINPAYRAIQLPVESWPLLDKSATGPNYLNTSSGNACLAQSPVPDRPLLDNPQETLSQVVIDMQFGFAPSEVSCSLVNGNVQAWSDIGAESIGSRFIIGLVPLAAADEYDLTTAALQTYVSPGAAAVFTSSNGRVFVTPTSASLQAAAALFKPDASLGSWQLPYTDYPNDASAQSAYPGTMLMSLDVPTAGLAKTAATDYAQYISFAATTGQAAGFGNGQLPPGYLPLTSANGLADEVAYSQAAAADVTAQNGAVPPLTPGSNPAGANGAQATGSGTFAFTSPNTSNGLTGNANGLSSTTGPDFGLASAGGGSSSAQSSSRGSKSGSSALIVPAAVVGAILGFFDSGLGGLALPLALLVALVFGAAAAALWWTRRHGVPSLRRRRAPP